MSKMYSQTLNEDKASCRLKTLALSDTFIDISNGFSLCHIYLLLNT